MLIRHADPGRDAAAISEIYAPYVRDTVISLEELPPDADEMEGRIQRINERYPWLIAESDGEVAGYAYGSAHHERAAYRWSADVTVYLSPAHHRRGIGRALYAALFELLARQGVYVACAGVTLPNPPSVGLQRRWGSLRSASIATSAGSSAPGATWAGGSASCASRAPRVRPSLVRRRASTADIPTAGPAVAGSIDEKVVHMTEFSSRSLETIIWGR